jgi:hypothetical protein
LPSAAGVYPRQAYIRILPMIAKTLCTHTIRNLRQGKVFAIIAAGAQRAHKTGNTRVACLFLAYPQPGKAGGKGPSGLSARPSTDWPGAVGGGSAERCPGGRPGRGGAGRAQVGRSRTPGRRESSGRRGVLESGPRHRRRRVAHSGRPSLKNLRAGPAGGCGSRGGGAWVRAMVTECNCCFSG